MANNLTLTNAAFDTAGQKYGSAALSGGYGVAPAGMLPSGPFAWEAWFKRSGTPGALEVIMGQSGVGWFGMKSDGTIQYEIGTNPPTDITSSSGSKADGAWHHAAVSCDGSTMRAFLDGALVGSGSVSINASNFAVSGTPPSALGYMGVNNHGGSLQFQFNGEVDEAVVWSTNRYTAAFTPPASYSGSEAGLLALWHLDSSGADSVGAVPTISAPAVSGLTAGASSTISGTFANGAPTALSQVLDGTTTSVASPTITTTSGGGATAAGTYSYTIATPAAGNHTLQVLGTGTYAASSGTTTFTTSAAPPVVLAPSNSAIVYSPYTWAGGKTINPGAYFRLAFTGSTIAFNFDVSAQATPLPQIWVSIDGYPPQQFTLASTVTPTMPALSAGWPKHTVEVVVKSTSEWVSRWSTQSAAVILTGITLASGATVSAPLALARNVLIYGDSITEGYHTVSALGSGQTDTDGSDSTLAYAHQLRRLLGAEVGVVGFGGTGLLGNGQGGVPPVGQSFNTLWPGQARSFTPAPSLVIVNEGTNDGGASSSTFQAAFQAFLSALLAAVPTCPIAVLRPFSGAQAGAIQAAIAALANARLRYLNTTGLFDTTLSVDGVHPLGVAAASIAPGVAALVTPLLTTAGGIVNRWSHS